MREKCRVGALLRAGLVKRQLTSRGRQWAVAVRGTDGYHVFNEFDVVLCFLFFCISRISKAIVSPELNFS